jgi:hypothetical protein
VEENFDYYKSGDLLLLESAGFTIHTRLRQWASVSVNTGFAARVNKAGETVESESRNGLDFIVNGKERVSLKHGQKYYFKYGGYIQSLVKTGFTLMKIVSAGGDFMEVNSFPVNVGSRKDLQDHIYNIVVKVENAKKYFSGFCVNSTPQHVKGIFQSEYNPKGIIKQKKCKRSKRLSIARKCRKVGIKSDAGLLRCIIDVCYNMKPLVERATEIIREEVKVVPIKHKVRTPQLKRAQKPGTCYSLGDPHYRTFSGRNFDNFWIGDFVLTSGRDFSVHARTRKYNNASVNKKIAANLNGDIVEAKSADKFMLNRETEVDLKVGQKYKLPQGGVVHRISSHRAYYYSNGAGFLDAEYLGAGKMRYVNLIVKVPNYPQTSGACQGNMIKAIGLFKKST